MLTKTLDGHTLCEVGWNQQVPLSKCGTGWWAVPQGTCLYPLTLKLVIEYDLLVWWCGVGGEVNKGMRGGGQLQVDLENFSFSPSTPPCPMAKERYRVEQNTQMAHQWSTLWPLWTPMAANMPVGRIQGYWSLCNGSIIHTIFLRVCFSNNISHADSALPQKYKKWVYMT